MRVSEIFSAGGRGGCGHDECDRFPTYEPCYDGCCYGGFDDRYGGGRRNEGLLGGLLGGGG
jgi:hypothetical protein